MQKNLWFCSALLLLFYGCTTADDTTVTMFHGGAEHKGVYGNQTFSQIGPVVWKIKTDGKIFSSPVYGAGLVYIGSEDSNVYAIDAVDGSVRWRLHTGGPVPSSPALYRGVVYFLSYDGYCYAVDGEDGKLVWRFQTEGEKKIGAYGLWTMKPRDIYMTDLYDFYLSSPVVCNINSRQMLFFGSSDGNVYALDARTGKLIWKCATGGIVHSTPAVRNNMVYVGSWDRNLYALDALTGKEQWRFQTKSDTVYHLLEGIQASAVVSDSLVLFGARDGYFYAVDRRSGVLQWKYDAKSSWILTTAAVRDSVVYFGTSDSYLFLALDLRSGAELYRFRAHGYIYSSPAISGNMAYFGDFTGTMYGLDLAAKGARLDSITTPGRNANAPLILNQKGDLDFQYVAGKEDPNFYQTGVSVMDKLYRLGPIVSSPVVAGDVLYFGSADSCLYAVKLVR